MMIGHILEKEIVLVMMRMLGVKSVAVVTVSPTSTYPPPGR